MYRYFIGWSSLSVTETTTNFACSPRSNRAGQTRWPTFSISAAAPGGGRNSAAVVFSAILASAASPAPAADINFNTWSESDAGNNAAAPNGFPEHMAPSGVNDAARAIMGGVRRWHDHISPTVTSAGTANAQTLTYATAPAAYAAGDVYRFIADTTNTASLALNVNSLSATALQSRGPALQGGEFTARQMVEVYFDGTAFQILHTNVPASAVTPEQFGAIGNGTTNDTTAMTACFNASATRGVACHLGSHTYVVDDIAMPSPLILTGDGPQASRILRLTSSSATGGVLHCFSSADAGCANTWISNLTIDGNKANESTASTVLNIGQYSNVHLRNIIVENSKAIGIGLDKSVDEAAGASSELINVTARDNNSDGIAVTTKSWHLLAENVVAMSNAGNGMHIYYTPNVTPVPAQFQYTTIRGGEFSSNGAAGFLARGWIKNYAGGFPIYGPGPEPVTHIIVTGVIARNNNRYGIVVQANEAVISDSVAMDNNLAGDYGGGFLGPCTNCQWNNLSSSGGFIGLDVGTSLGVHVRGGTFTGNRFGVNIGGSHHSDVRGATATNNTEVQIHAIAAEGDGDGYGIEGYTTTLVIEGNRMGCGNTGTYGLRVYNGGLNITVTDNHVQGCDIDKAISLEVDSASVDNNTVVLPGVSKLQGTVDLNVTDQTTTLVIPAWVNSIELLGTNNFSNVRTYEQAAAGTGIYSVQITTPGRGYANGVATATVSGCSVAPTGVVAVNRGGEVTGYRISGHGSGCVSPTISFAGGTGATGVVRNVPLSTAWNKKLTMIVGDSGSLTIGGSGNVILASSLSGLGSTSVVNFHWSSLGLYEESRVVH
jgi:hypothetical protein